MAAPVVSSVAPNTGPPAGGTAVTITGTGFTGATSVRFASQIATNVVVVSDTSITCKTPSALADAVVGISVTAPGGTGTTPNLFTYSGPTGTSDVFPAFVPIVPPPPIGNAQTIPTFPPPTPPPIGQVPVGPLVGPAIAAAAVPPSVAGFPQPQFKTGSAVAPPSGGYWPIFTSTFPTPTIVFSNIFTGHSPPTTPPSTASTLNIVLDGWGPSVPPGAPTAPGGDGRFPRMVETLAAAAAMGELHKPHNPEPAHHSKRHRK